MVPWQGHHVASTPKSQYHHLKISDRDFPGGPVVKTSPFNARGAGLIPGWGAMLPHASRPKNQKTEAILYQIQ